METEAFGAATVTFGTVALTETAAWRILLAAAFGVAGAGAGAA